MQNLIPLVSSISIFFCGTIHCKQMLPTNCRCFNTVFALFKAYQLCFNTLFTPFKASYQLCFNTLFTLFNNRMQLHYLYNQDIKINLKSRVTNITVLTNYDVVLAAAWDDESYFIVNILKHLSTSTGHRTYDYI